MGAFLEDPAEHHRSGAAPDGAQSSEDARTADDEPAQPRGTGTAARGRVRASVDAAGRVAGFDIDDAFLEHGPKAVADAVRTAVNAALDDLADGLADGDLAGLDGELGRVTAEFDRALDRVHKDIAEAERRLGY